MSANDAIRALHSIGGVDLLILRALATDATLVEIGKSLFLTAPAVTQRMNKIQGACLGGRPLFYKSGRSGRIMTADGLKLARVASTIISAWETSFSCLTSS